MNPSVGLTIPCQQPIAILIEEGADVSAFENFSVKDAGGESAGPAAPKEEKTTESEPSNVEPEPSQAPTSADELVTSSSGRLETALDREPNITPAAKRLARENGVVLEGLKGTGKDGKLVEEDIKKAMSSKAAAGPGVGYEDTPVSGMRNAIANRLKGSVQNNPHFYVTSKISVSKLLKLRQALNSEADGKYKLSVNDFLIKAVAVASQKVPTVNSSWRDGFIRQFNTVDVAVAVATPSGLITPIVAGTEARGLESISNKVKELAKRARDNKLKPEEYQGGSICISNMGMNDAVDHFTAIINPPHAAILAVGAIKKVPVPAENEDGTTGIAWDEQITITGSFDHKVIDGVIGADWVKEMKKVLENPLSLML